MQGDATRYFACVRRGADGRYDAQLPDFPHRRIAADCIDGLVQALREAILQELEARDALWPPPPCTSGLPRLVDHPDGFWIQVDLSQPPLQSQRPNAAAEAFADAGSAATGALARLA